MHTLSRGKQSRRKLTLWTTVILLASIILIPLLPYTIAAVKEGISNPNPGAQFWRDVRQRDGEVAGSSQVQGVDSGILISKEG
ncbi:MAG: hypothetical protein P8Y28_02790, partial [Gammaproteobacteria bacterium]